jgi:hypothetical protein
VAYDVPQYFTPEHYQARLEKMTDDQLKEEGKGRTFLCSPTCFINGKADPYWVSQLEACRAEWRRRHAKEGSREES